MRTGLRWNSYYWLSIGIKEVYRSTAADLQNRSILLAVLALVILPVDMLPHLYMDWTRFICSGFLPAEAFDKANAMGFAAVQCLLLLTLSLWRRRLYGAFSQVAILEKTLPFRRASRFSMAVTLGFITHLPVFIVMLLAGISAAVSRNVNVGLMDHLTAGIFICLLSALMTLLMIALSEFSWSRKMKQESNVQCLGSSRIAGKMPWLFFLGNRLLRQEYQRLLVLVALNGIALSVFIGKDRSEILSLGPPIGIACSGLISLGVSWVLKPLIDEGRLFNLFMCTLPSRLIIHETGEELISLILQLPFTVFLLVYLSLGGCSAISVFGALIACVTIQRGGFRVLMSKPRLYPLFVILGTACLAWAFSLIGG